MYCYVVKGHLHDGIIILLIPRILQGFAFLCRTGLWFLLFQGITKFKYERKKQNELWSSRDVIVQMGAYYIQELTISEYKCRIHYRG